MPSVCRGGDCEARMRASFEQAVQRAPERPAAKDATVAQKGHVQRTLAIAIMQAQPGKAYQTEQETTVLEYVLPGGEDNRRMPSLLEPFQVLDRTTDKLRTIHGKECLSIDTLHLLVWACGAGKSFQLFHAIEAYLADNPHRPILFVSAKKVHAGDLAKNLEKLSFLVYLENESAQGMGERITKHVCTQKTKGLGPRVVCNITSIRALPKEFLDAFVGQHGMIVMDEARTIAGYVRHCDADEQPTFQKPDVALDRLVEMARWSTVVFLDADGLCDGGAIALAKRIAPQKAVRVIASPTHYLERDLEVAFGTITVKKEEKVGAADDVNEARRSFLNYFFAAVRRARVNVDERVYVQAASKAQIEKLKAMLVERGLWDNQKCKAYHGASDDKADLVDTATAWADVYLVMCNSVVTVAINIEVPFGATFMLTANAKKVAHFRDEAQGIVRTWRKPSLEPPPGAMGRGPNGRLRTFVLIGCAPPEGVADTLKDATKRGVAVTPADFAAWQRREHAKQLRELRAGAADAKAKHGDKAESANNETLKIMAWNGVERTANESHHFSYVLHMSKLLTRGWEARCIEPYTEEAPAPAPPPPVGGDDEEAEREGEVDEEREAEFDVDAADALIRSYCTRDDAIYAWFLNTFVSYFLRFSFVRVSNAFFSASGDYSKFVCALTGRQPSNVGNGCMRRALGGIYKALYPIQRFVELPSEEQKPPSPYTILKNSEVVLRRRANFRLFSAEELRAQPRRVEISVQMTDLVVLQKLQRAAVALRLTVADLLGFKPGEGGFSLSGDDAPTAPVSMGCVETALDFRPREEPGQGQRPADLHCGGRWGFAGDVHERFDYEHRTGAIGAAWEVLQNVACDLNASMHNARPLTLLSKIVETAVGNRLCIKRERGPTVRGTETRKKVSALTLVQRAEGLAQRVTFSHATRDTDGGEWSAAFAFKAKQAEIDKSRAACDAQVQTDVADASQHVDMVWQEAATGSATTTTSQAVRTLVATMCGEAGERDFEHAMPLDVSGAQAVLDLLRTRRGYGEVCDALQSALANVLGTFVPITRQRTDNGCGPRRYGGNTAFNPLDVPSQALAVMLGDGVVDRLRLDDVSERKGLLPLRLFHKHVHLQRQLLGGSSVAVPDGPSPQTRADDARRRCAELKERVTGGDHAPDTLRALASAQEAAVAAEQTARAAPPPTKHDAALPSTAKLEALLHDDSRRDCEALARALLSGRRGGSDLSREDNDVCEEASNVIDALIDKGGDWQAGLRERLVNRKKVELRRLDDDKKAKKEAELRAHARRVLLERLVDDAARLVEGVLAQANCDKAYVHFVDARGDGSVHLYVPRVPDLGLRRDDGELYAHVSLPNIGAMVRLSVDNDALYDSGLKYASCAEWVTSLRENAPASAQPAAAIQATAGGDAEDREEDDGEDDVPLSEGTDLEDVTDDDEGGPEHMEDEGRAGAECIDMDQERRIAAEREAERCQDAEAERVRVAAREAANAQREVMRAEAAARMAVTPTPGFRVTVAPDARQEVIDGRREERDADGKTLPTPLEAVARVVEEQERRRLAEEGRRLRLASEQERLREAEKAKVAVGASAKATQPPAKRQRSH